jgi:dienelactone hydrolase
MLHGTFGLLPCYRPDIVAFAEALAGKGTVALLPHYFDRTGTAAGLTPVPPSRAPRGVEGGAATR